MVELTRKEYNVIAKNRGIIEPQDRSTQEFINTLSSYYSRHKVKEIAKLRRIKNGKELSKEELIIALLKSESSTAERNSEKRFNNDNNNTDDDDNYDGKITGKICDINIIFSRLGNIVTNKERKEITKKLYEIEQKKNLLDKEK